MSTIGYNKNRMTVENRSSANHPLYLPPPDVWHFTPGKDEPLPTPLDERGLVDVDALIATVRETIDPHFAWEPSERPDDDPCQ